MGSLVRDALETELGQSTLANLGSAFGFAPDTSKKLATVASTPTGELYARQFLENLNPFKTSAVGEELLNPTETETLKSIVGSKLAKGKTGLSYSDFGGQKITGYKMSIPDLTDPNESLKFMLGKADITRDEEGNIYVEDVYNFEGPGKEEGFLNKLGMAKDAVLSGDMSLYGKAHRIGELFGADIPVKIKVGNISDFDLNPKQVSKIPMYRGFEASETQVAEAPAEVPSEPTAYTVQKGDTLGKIAKRTGFSVDELVAFNNIKDANKIGIGQKIALPVVQPTPSKEQVVAMSELMQGDEDLFRGDIGA